MAPKDNARALFAARSARQFARRYRAPVCLRAFEEPASSAGMPVVTRGPSLLQCPPD
jgi:hypothetical protein